MGPSSWASVGPQKPTISQSSNKISSERRYNMHSGIRWHSATKTRGHLPSKPSANISYPQWPDVKRHNKLTINSMPFVEQIQK